MCISVSFRQSAGCSPPTTPGSPGPTFERVEDDGSSRSIRSCFFQLPNYLQASLAPYAASVHQTYPHQPPSPTSPGDEMDGPPPCCPHNSGSRKARAGPRTLSQVLLFWKKEAELIGLGIAKSGIGPWPPPDGIPHQQHLTCVPVCQSFHAQEPRHSRLELTVVVLSLPVNRNGRKQF